jgi:hypothetical protein
LPVIAAILFCVSTVAFGQFVLYYWRSMIACVAMQPVSDRLRSAAGVAATSLGSGDFRAIMSLRDLAPDLRGAGSRFRVIRSYYFMVEKLGRLIPSMAAWSEAEMTTCSRYIAVLIDQQLQRNFASAVQVRGI